MQRKRSLGKSRPAKAQKQKKIAFTGNYRTFSALLQEGLLAEYEYETESLLANSETLLHLTVAELAFNANNFTKMLEKLNLISPLFQNNPHIQCLYAVAYFGEGHVKHAISILNKFKSTEMVKKILTIAESLPHNEKNDSTFQDISAARSLNSLFTLNHLQIKLRVLQMLEKQQDTVKFFFESAKKSLESRYQEEFNAFEQQSRPSI